MVRIRFKILVKYGIYWVGGGLAGEWIVPLFTINFYLLTRKGMFDINFRGTRSSEFDDTSRMPGDSFFENMTKAKGVLLTGHVNKALF
jgi:hypothetical protein